MPCFFLIGRLRTILHGGITIYLGLSSIEENCDYIQTLYGEIKLVIKDLLTIAAP